VSWGLGSFALSFAAVARGYGVEECVEGAVAGVRGRRSQVQEEGEGESQEWQGEGQLEWEQK
jgi:hypothetical protein